MNRYLLETEEGVHTVMCDVTGQSFHSRFGSLQESRHVFIRNGLESILNRVEHPSILEVGFGSGLNALLTLKFLAECGSASDYTAIELYPLEMEVVNRLNFFNYIDRRYRARFFEMHTCEWDVWNDLGNLRFMKIRLDISTSLPDARYDLIYFDTFSPTVQPELWTEEVFRMLADRMNPDAILVTYCCKGDVQRNMTAAGLIVQKCEGPRGKREMLIAKKASATKNDNE